MCCHSNHPMGTAKWWSLVLSPDPFRKQVILALRGCSVVSAHRRFSRKGPWKPFAHNGLDTREAASWVQLMQGGGGGCSGRGRTPLGFFGEVLRGRRRTTRIQTEQPAFRVAKNAGSGVVLRHETRARTKTRPTHTAVWAGQTSMSAGDASQASWVQGRRTTPSGEKKS